MQHVITVEGRSLIRTFLAGATKGAAVIAETESKLGRKRNIFFVLLSFFRNFVRILSFSLYKGSLGN